MESQSPGPPGKSLINDFKKHDIQKKPQTWYPRRIGSRKCACPLQIPKSMGAQFPCIKWQCSHPWYPQVPHPQLQPPVDTQGWLYGFSVCNFSCSFLTCLADPLCRSWEQRCLRRSTVTSREQGSGEPARQRSGQLWKQWCLEPATVLRLTNYSTLRSSCWSPGQKGSLFPRTIMKQLSEASRSQWTRRLWKSISTVADVCSGTWVQSSGLYLQSLVNLLQIVVNLGLSVVRSILWDGHMDRLVFLKSSPALVPLGLQQGWLTLALAWEKARALHISTQCRLLWVSRDCGQPAPEGGWSPASDMLSCFSGALCTCLRLLAFGPLYPWMPNKQEVHMCKDRVNPFCDVFPKLIQGVLTTFIHGYKINHLFFSCPIQKYLVERSTSIWG